MVIWEDDDFYIESEEHNLPWVKIFTKKPYKELSELPLSLYSRLWEIYFRVEKTMLKYYNPDKINMASFGNMLPHVHIHVMARFGEDEYFPNPLWGEKTQNSNLKLPSYEEFCKCLADALER